MSYDANSIQIRDFRTACRATPGMYLGASGQDAAFNCFLEVLNNSCDEAMMNRGDKIEIILSDDGNTLTCSDAGAGVPSGPNKDCKEVLIELFCSAHSSGKFDTTNYKKVRGCHGIGTSAVCVCSSSFEVWSRRDGAEHYLKFEEGIPCSETSQEIRKTNETGSTFRFTPNREVLHIDENNPIFDAERIRKELQLTSYFIPKVYFIFSYQGTKETFYSKNGLKDFARDCVEKPLHKSFIYGYREFDDEVEVEVFAQWTAGKETEYVFSNGALNIDGGTPISGARTAFTRTINSLSKGDFTADMIRKGLVYIINVRHPHPIYQNQTKSRIQNAELRGYTQTVFTEAIKDFVKKHKDEFDKVVEILTKEKKAEMAAERARQAILNHEKEQKANEKKKLLNYNKLRDARKLGKDSILLCVEGISAGGSMSIGRDPNTYGILILRGKVKNLLKATIEEGLNNEEVKLLLQALGIIYGKPYNSDKLRYGRVALAVDGDFDGSHIGLLLMAMLQVLAPQFLKENRLFWLRAPTCKVETKTKTYYYYNEEEFRSHPKGNITFFKGLGQMTDEDLKNSMFNKEWQHLEPITYSEEGIQTLLELMSEDVEPRKEFVFNNIDFSKFEVE